MTGEALGLVRDLLGIAWRGAAWGALILGWAVIAYALAAGLLP